MEIFNFQILDGMWRWIIQVFIIVFCCLCLNFIQKFVLGRLQKRLEQTKTPWDHSVIQALRAPLGLLIWIIGISFSAHVIEKETGKAIFSAVPLLRRIAIIVVIGWFFLRLIKKGEKNFRALNEKKGRSIDHTTTDAISKILRASVIITSGLVLLQTMGVSISGVLAFGGVGGIAVGFAAKDLLANFFGAFIIYWDRPFKVGDWIRSPDREIEGCVEHIGWRLTRIRTFDKRPLYVPNSIFSSITVENPSRMTNRRIKETVGIRYCDFDVIPKILSEIRTMLKNHPDIDQNQTTMVHFDAFGASSLDFFIHTFTKTTLRTKFHQVKEDVLLKVHQIITSQGAEVAYPTSTLFLPEQKVLTEEKIAQETLT